ncbi:Hypothetical predicted protein [Mytilus galloprovincialis]|uniref:RNase H type-1 domain-containing protein n=1 Tax=Mytilus galloprovincialis TaxID=29158 RepID=A0A8B6G1W2_MYTGA|nr:Hypothetical predicted protein [Mytilus galloprovincialis]
MSCTNLRNIYLLRNVATAIPLVYFVVQSSTSSHLDKLNEIQRKGLALCLDLPSQSSLEALEVLSGTLPIDLRREEMAIRELGKINSYNGSCLGNPGPCGAGAIIYINDKEEKLKRPVSNKGSILLAELIAIKMVLDYIESFSKEQINTLTLFSDSQTALGILTLNWKSDSYHQTINEIKGKIKNLNEHGFLINLNWTPGHANIKGNDEADRSLAKEAAKEAETLAVDDIVFTKQDVKKSSQEILLQKKNGNADGKIVILDVTISDFILKLKDKVKKRLPVKKNV